MAAQNEPLLADVHKFQIETSTAGTYKTVAFITGLEVNRSRAAREISSFDDCGETVERPGRATRSLSGTFYIQNGTTAEWNHVDVEKLFDDKEEFKFKIVPIDCEGDEMVGEYEREGEGFLTELGDSHQLGESSVASFTINVKGALKVTVITA
jgi:predicted secreted protein